VRVLLFEGPGSKLPNTPRLVRTWLFYTSSPWSSTCWRCGSR